MDVAKIVFWIKTGDQSSAFSVQCVVCTSTCDLHVMLLIIMFEGFDCASPCEKCVRWKVILDGDWRWLNGSSVAYLLLLPSCLHGQTGCVGSLFLESLCVVSCAILVSECLPFVTCFIFVVLVGAMLCLFLESNTVSYILCLITDGPRMRDVRCSGSAWCWPIVAI